MTSSPAPGRARLLVIAGSDSGGGAGIQADIKTATAFGVFAMTAITALTVQDTTGVHAIHAVPPDFVARQIACVLADLGADAIKIGMLGDAATIAAVADALAPELPLVVDPVMVAKGGAPLLAAAAVDALRRQLLPRATLLTPNLPEAEILLGRPIETRAAMRDAAHALLALGPRAVLLKGGHLASDTVPDLLATASGIHEMEAPRIPSRHTHGTGCTLASAIACGLARGEELRDAVERARRYVRAAIEGAPGLGRGHGPLDHMVWLHESGREEEDVLS